MKREIQIGSTLTNGNTVVRVTHRRENGWGGLYISLSQHRERYTGQPYLIHDYLVGSWDHIPFEWSPLPGSGLEHRYKWQRGCRWIRHELRKAER